MSEEPKWFDENGREIKTDRSGLVETSIVVHEHEWSEWVDIDKNYGFMTKPFAKLRICKKCKKAEHDIV